MLELALICLALALLLAYRERVGARERGEARRQAREREREYELARAALRGERARERAVWREEREGLLQRIQAPETAVIEHAQAQRPERRKARPIAADDDAAFVARERPESGD